MTSVSRTALGWRAAAAVAVTGLTLVGCGASSSSTNAAAPAAAGAAGGQVLPVTSNPIKNSSTAQTLKIESVLVENNVDPMTKKTVSDHVEIALRNTGSTALTGFEFYYTFTDSKTNASESYYAKAPDTFSIPAGGTRVANFDGLNAPDHFPVNKFSLYYQSKNALDVKVIVSAAGAAVQTATVKKAAGGPETVD